MSQFNWAPAIYRRLNGLLCVFKPEGVPGKQVLERLQFNIARDLNALPCYKTELAMIKENPHADFSAPLVIDPSSPVPTENFLEHRLVLGQRFVPSDINMNYIHGMSRHSTGVLLVAMGRGKKDLLEILALSKFLRVYHVKGRFGWATHNFTPKGKIIERTSFRHIHPIKLDKVIASVQSSHLQNMFHFAGVDSDSQEAYELAAQGLVRPQDSHTPPVIYSIKCVDFQLPNFTLEIHSINEYCDYFKQIIHEIGLQLKSTAVCTGIRRIRYGHFDVSCSLLRQQWNLRDVLENLRQNDARLTPKHLGGGKHIEKITSGEVDTRKRIEC